MARPPRDASRRYHDRVARQYDSIYDDPYWAFHDELTWRMVKPHLPRDLSAACCDLGCGTGKWGLKLLKSGFATTFVDLSAAMIEQVRGKLDEMGPAKAKKANLVVADIVEMPMLAGEQFSLLLAMGDPLSICSDPVRAAREMHRITKAGGIVIATADNKLAALDHFVERGNLDVLEEFIHTGKTNWLTADERERFELTNFTPASLRKLFEKSGFDVLAVNGKPIIPVRANKQLLTHDGAIERLLRLEQELSKDPAAAGRAGHLQVTAKRLQNVRMSLAEQQDQVITIETRPRWPVVVLIVLAVALPVTIGALKINALTAWRYTSDLFTVDTLLQETLRGNFGMEFTYGRQFGDHACLIFLALLPLKWLLGTKMVFALVLLPAIAFAICGVILFRCARDVAGARWAVLATIVYFLSVGVFRGPFEHVFGFHIDTLSGYVAVAMAALLMRYDHLRDRGSGVTGAASAIAAACVFALLKEEMALLGVIFFIVLLALGRRDRVHLMGLLVCLAIFAIELIVIRLSRTAWNRGNASLVGLLTGQVRDLGLFGFFFSGDKLDYWGNTLALLIFFFACAHLAGRLNPYAAALAVAGVAKLAFAWFVADFHPWTWHNYPALVMLTGGVALQALELRHVPHRATIAAATMVILAIGNFAAREVPFLLETGKSNASARAERDRLRPALLDVLRHVEREKIASVPKWTAYEWSQGGHRFTFFPHGITSSPQGTADVLVTRRSKFSTDPDQTKAFTLVYQNGHYRLWRRSGYLPNEEHSRGMFIDLFGRDALGLGPEKTKKKPPKKKRRPATTSAP